MCVDLGIFSVLRLVCNVYGMTPVDEMTIGMVLTDCTCHCVLISMARSVYFVFFFCKRCGKVVCIWYGYIYEKYCFVLFIVESYVRPVEMNSFVCNYSSVPVEFKVC